LEQSWTLAIATAEVKPRGIVISTRLSAVATYGYRWRDLLRRD
jgi:hypothetical protein